MDRNNIFHKYNNFYSPVSNTRCHSIGHKMRIARIKIRVDSPYLLNWSCSWYKSIIWLRLYIVPLKADEMRWWHFRRIVFNGTFSTGHSIPILSIILSYFIYAKFTWRFQIHYFSMELNFWLHWTVNKLNLKFFVLHFGIPTWPIVWWLWFCLNLRQPQKN